MNLEDAYQQVFALVEQLQLTVKKDQEQEVRGPAIAVVDRVLEQARGVLPPDDPIVSSIRDVVSPEAIEEGEPIRAIDLLLVVDQLKTRLRSLMDEQMGPMTISMEPGPFDRDF